MIISQELTIDGGKIYSNMATGAAGGFYGAGIYLRKDAVYNYISGTVESNTLDDVYRNS